MGRTQKLHLRMLCAVAVLLLPALMGLCVQDSSAAPSAGPVWWNEDWHYRHRFSVGPMGFEMLNYPAEVELDFNRLLAESGAAPAPVNLASLCLVEYSGSGNDGTPVKQSDGRWAVPLMFTPSAGFDPVKHQSGRILFSMNGTVPAGARRYYNLYFDTRPGFEELRYDLSHLNALYWMGRGQILYGFNPGVEHTYLETEALRIVGLHEGTTLVVYNITGGQKTAIGKGVVGLGGSLNFKIPDGVFFSVEADKPVTATMDNAMSISASAWYPARDGQLAGKDFYFISYQTDPSGTMVYAFEDSTVIVYDRGKEVSRFQLSRGPSILRVQPNGGRMLHVTATGRIMLGPISINGFTAEPSNDGAPVGNEFSIGIKYWRWDRQTTNSLVLFAHEASTATIEPTIGNLPSVAINLAAGEFYYYAFNSSSTSLYEILSVHSSGNISVMAGGNELSAQIDGLGDDITFCGGQQARYFNIYALHNPPPAGKDDPYPGPSPSGIVFSFFDDNRVIVDDIAQSLGKDGYIVLKEGQHIIKSDKPVSVMSLGRAQDGRNNHRWNDWGSYLSGRLLFPPVTVAGTETNDVYYGVELLPGPGETEAAAGLIIHGTLPGYSSSYSVRVKNTGNRDDIYRLSVSALPPGWNFTRTVPDSLSIPVNDSALFTVDVTSPSNALADDWAQLVVSAVSSGNTSQSDTISLRLVVNATYFIQMYCNESMARVWPGQGWSFPVVLRNGGNARDNISISAFRESGAAWQFSLTCSTVGLASGEAADFRLEVSCPPTARALQECAVRVTAVSAGNATMTASVLTRTVANQTYGATLASEPSENFVRPSEAANFSLTVGNTGNGQDTCALGLEGVPANWSGSLSSSSVVLEPDQKQLVQAIITPPAGTPPGSYGLKASVRSLSGNASEVPLTVRVLQVYGVRIDNPEIVRTARAGIPLSFPVYVQNTGNGKDNVTLSFSGPGGWSGRFSPSGVSLSPGEQAPLSISVTIPAGTRSGIYSFNVTAQTAGGATHAVKMSVSVTGVRESVNMGDWWCTVIAASSALCFGGYLAAYEYRRRRGLVG